MGLNAFHADAAACLVSDGKLIAAAEEERFRRIKHWAGFPSEAIKWCLQEAGASLGDISHLAVNQDSSANNWRRAEFLLRQRPSMAMVIDRLSTRKKRASAAQLLEEIYPGQHFKGQTHAVEHHLAHLSSAFHVSPFEQAVAISVDGFGDFASAAWGIGRGVEIDINDRIYFPHSLGIFYQAMTQFLGFAHYGDEYKVMGLAPYGQPRYVDRVRDMLVLKDKGRFALNLKYFRHHKEYVPYQWENGSPVFGDLFAEELEALLGPRRKPDDPLMQRHRDLARSTQALYEEAFFHLIAAAQNESGITDLVLAGGCANNSVANGKVRRQTPFKRVYVHAAPGDAGGAIGAAFAVWHEQGGARHFVMDHAYWGPAFGDATCAALLQSKQAELDAAGCTVARLVDEEALCRRTAEAVAVGKVVGWFQGRMEWGPRALGNRSIVCDPRRGDMKQILNAKIKRRESFRPFAPSVLAEYVGAWFEEDDAVPFMMQVFQIREEKRAQLPAVTHVDGSGRLQSVNRDTNPRYAKLIDAFHEITGVPIVLNTSFNENEPVVCRPEEALDCFLRTQMDVLVIGEHFVERTHAVSAALVT
ncbi:carbamoyltransferase family protein [Terricaulis silvestris]|uniref:carbamoyltransferase family protein n=1 Tax=Terricaulis silvestris TaxID=2686094 RepID=UPI00225E48A4|nr:carbamoyltransferase C-terminal domain-containing protein [Terricaulis silvestris]